MVSNLGERAPKQRRPVVIPAPISLLLIPVMLLVAGASIPYMICVAILQNRAEKRYVEARRREGRLLKYGDVREAAIARKGTLVVEKLSSKGPWRFWWTSDDLRQICPVILPTADREEGLIEVDDAFRAWFSERYIDGSSGASLVDRSEVQKRQIYEELKVVPHLSFEHWPKR